MTTATKKNTRRALYVFLLIVGAMGFFIALGKALSTLIADEDKSKNSNATEMLDRFIGDSKDHGESQYQLGMMYRHGEGCETNNEDAESQCAPSKLSSKNEFAKMKAKSVKWMHHAAENGTAEASYILGLMYLNGCGVDKNKGEAKKWFRKSGYQSVER